MEFFMEASNLKNTLPKRLILWRGIKGQCPNCGRGRLFKAYLQQVDKCAICDEEISSIRADDGPAWLTILLTGHIVAPMIAYFALHETLHPWLAMSILLTIALSVVFFLLPRTKGLFVAAIWLTRQKG